MNVEKLCVGCENCNRKSPLFETLNEEELTLINKDRYSVRFHEGEVILKQGTHANYFISIIEGFAKNSFDVRKKLALNSIHECYQVIFIGSVRIVPFKVNAHLSEQMADVFAVDAHDAVVFVLPICI